MKKQVKLKVPYSMFGSVYGQAEEKAALKTMRQDTLTMGPQIAAFEKEFAAYCGSPHAIAISNCTTALHLATQVFGIRAGDEVITTPNTFVATSLGVLKEGGRPVFADIDPKTYNIDPREIERQITAKTKAIYVVHYGGQMCDMDPIMALARKRRLYVLEDCAHTPGAEYKGRKAGTIGDIGCFSFHALKNMTTLGEGGMITTSHPEWVAKIKALKCMNIRHWEHQTDYWIPSFYDVVDLNGYWGNNYRMSEVQAAVGRIQLKKLDRLNAQRRRIGRYLNKNLAGLPGLVTVYEAPAARHVYHLYTLYIEEERLRATRDDLMRILYREEGIEPLLHYQPTYQYSALKKLGYPDQLCPIAERFFKRHLHLPLHPRLTRKDLDTMIAALKSALKKLAKRGAAGK